MAEPKFLKSLADVETWREKAASGKASSKVVLRKQFVSEVEVEDDRSIKFTITTSAPDREKDVINSEGWELSAFLKNPVVLFAHDYDALPVAKATSIEQQGDSLVATAQFAPKELNPMAEQVFQMLKAGFLKGASVGFRPLTFSYNEDRGGVDFGTQELLEFSVVPVPANAQALMAAGLKGLDTEVMREWAEQTLDTLNEVSIHKGVSPTNISTETAPMDARWRAPMLGDYVDEPWEELGGRQRRRIAGHFAWATAAVPEKFGDMKLPHHRSEDGYVVWRGVVAASGRLDQTRLPNEDLSAVKRHLARHFKEFDRTAPWERDASSWAAFIKARTRAEAKLSASLSDQELARLLDDFGFEDEAIALSASLHEQEQTTVHQEQSSDALIKQDGEDANKLIDIVREDLNRIQNIAKKCIVGIDEYQNSLRDDDDEETENQNDEENEEEEYERMMASNRSAFDISLNDVVLELVEDSPELLEIDIDSLADSIRSAVTQTIGESVRSEMRDSVNAMRGRID
jgi:HK97 family phage prohead protease